MSKEEFDRIDEEYAKSQQKAYDEYFDSVKPIYVHADLIPRDSPLPIRQTGNIKPLRHKFFLSDAQKKEIEEMMKPFNERIKNHLFLSTDNPDPNSWLRNFMQTDMKPETKDKILFKFGEFVGTLSKEEKCFPISFLKSAARKPSGKWITT